jgi:hypothetical protein
LLALLWQAKRKGKLWPPAAVYGSAIEQKKQAAPSLGGQRSTCKVNRSQPLTTPARATYKAAKRVSKGGKHPIRASLERHRTQDLESGQRSVRSGRFAVVIPIAPTHPLGMEPCR